MVGDTHSEYCECIHFRAVYICSDNVRAAQRVIKRKIAHY